MPTYYQILGVAEDALSDEIKAAFKKQALKFHPDRNQGDPAMEELFKELNSAYQTLSNPYTRHRYDMTLKFGSFELPPQPTTPPPPRYYRRPRRPIFHRPSLTSRENLMATMYAFLFAFVVGLFIKIGIWATDYYKAIEREKLLTERREVFGMAQSAFKKGELRESLLIIDEMGMFFESEMDMREYKDMLLGNILIRADQCMEDKLYKKALSLYSILDNFPNGNSLNILLNKAEANKQLGNFQRAIDIYHQLFYIGYRNTSFYIELGGLYENGPKDYESALQYYEKATDMAVSEYEAVFGKAYPVMINANFIPKHHFQLFTKLANMYYLTGDFERGIKSTIWSKEIWPDSAANYIISGQCHQALGETDLACQDFNIAKNLDASFQSPLDCP
ncbi:MAG: DnaJ domain-containing protein [Cyclobacteriaceae bacterium]